MIISNLGPTFQGSTEYFQGVINPLQALTPACGYGQVKAILRLTDDDIIINAEEYDTRDEIEDLIIVATEAAHKFTLFEHAKREIEIRYDVHPYKRNFYDGLTPLGMIFASWVELSVYPIISIDDVRLYFEDDTELEVTNFREDLLSKPARIKLDRKTVRISNDLASFRVKVTAGPKNIEKKSYERAVAQLAAYMYDNTGCSTKNAMKESGALDMLRKYQLKRGL